MPLGFQPGFFALTASKSGRGTGLRRVFGAILPQESGSHLMKELLNATAILQCAFEHWDHLEGHIHASPPPVAGEGQQVIGMLGSASTGLAIRPDAGLAHLGQATFEGRPQSKELFLKAF